MNTTEQMISKAKVGVILKNPFFASLVLGMQYAENKEIKTCCTDGTTVEFNPDFIQGLPPEQRSTVFAHEALHTGLLHHCRIDGKDADLFNQAADYAINLLLKESLFELPGDALIDIKYKNWTAEEIYNELFKQQQKKQQDQNQPGNGQGQGQGAPKPQQDKKPQNFGEVKKPETMTATNKAEHEAKAKQKVAQATELARQAGKLPGGIAEAIHKLLSPELNWDEILNRFIAEVCHDDYTWTKPSPRYLPSGLYLPALENQQVGKVVFAMDTSGSVDEQLLKKFVTELSEISEIFSVPVTVIHCDTRVQKVEELEPGTDIIPVGRGGTNFIPPFVYTNEYIPEAKALVYFTDGDCYQFPTYEPDYPVLWVIYRKRQFNPPFGEVIYVN